MARLLSQTASETVSESRPREGILASKHGIDEIHVRHGGGVSGHNMYGDSLCSLMASPNQYTLFW